jgi:hypothetical protein
MAVPTRELGASTSPSVYDSGARSEELYRRDSAKVAQYPAAAGLG